MSRAVAFYFKEQNNDNSFYGIGGIIELDLTRKEVLRYALGESLHLECCLMQR